jgi:hypothetical protein
MQDFLMAALQRLQALTQGRVVRSPFELMNDLAVEALQFVALPSQLGPFARHLELHFAHLTRQRLFVRSQLTAFAFQVLTQSKELLFARAQVCFARRSRRGALQ